MSIYRHRFNVITSKTHGSFNDIVTYHYCYLIINIDIYFDI